MSEAYYQMYLDELKEIKPCTDMEREQLLKGAAAGDEEARARLVEGHLIFALAVAKDYRDQGVAMSDLMQEASLGLTMAALEYKEGDFLEMAREKMIDCLQKAIKEQKAEQEVGEAMAARVNVLQEISAKMAEELGREATVEELADRMRMTSEEIREIMKLAVDALSITGDYGELMDEAGVKGQDPSK